jgi:hypothetical protein
MMATTRKKLNESFRGDRAEYVEEILHTLSAKFAKDYGQGFLAKNLRWMTLFREVFLKAAIVVTLARELSWSHSRWRLENREAE